ncbi:hypothetical protein LH51_11495 [Nitrincola sp. A-D6]|nr:hypothetical protein LH51_11495 [Nitrincola sp. A-D6]
MAHRVSQIRSHQPHQLGCQHKVVLKSVFTEDFCQTESLNLNSTIYVIAILPALLQTIVGLAQDFGRGGGITLM